MKDIATQKKRLMKDLCEFFVLLESTEVYSRMDGETHDNLSVAFNTFANSINSVTTHTAMQDFAKKVHGKNGNTPTFETLKTPKILANGSI